MWGVLRETPESGDPQKWAAFEKWREAFAQFERELMLERQRDGIAKAKAEGRYKGRKPTAMAKADEVKALAAEGIGPSAIAQSLGIGRTSVYRILNPAEA
jgi:DNA invertase Pin-like site-specific DNA recombinase